MQRPLPQKLPHDLCQALWRRLGGMNRKRNFAPRPGHAELFIAPIDTRANIGAVQPPWKGDDIAPLQRPLALKAVEKAHAHIRRQPLHGVLDAALRQRGAKGCHRIGRRVDEEDVSIALLTFGKTKLR